MSQRITRLASVGTSESPVLRRARKNQSNVELRRQETGADSGTPPDKPKVYIPCPSCRGPIEVPVEGELPQSLECPHCGVVTHRPASGQQRAEMVTWVTYTFQASYLAALAACQIAVESSRASRPGTT